jgi:hypothetical protein
LLDIKYFAELEGLSAIQLGPLINVMKVNGVVVPDQDDINGSPGVTTEQAELLRDYFHPSRGWITGRSSLDDLLQSNFGNTDYRLPRVAEILEPIRPLFPVAMQFLAPSDLGMQERYLLSRDLDGQEPYLTKLTLPHLLKAAAAKDFAGLTRPCGRIGSSIG